ncbi:sensor domain-containing diguanylate cyclase [Pseudomonas stutzeri]|uniref:diguanylate cyclase n=1 Tax=Stutzerimonas stutzeri TaxID=316 RepID=A0A2N8S082_STUST|nr:diguanylate cyclase [Stutzerimonas stutzeri]MCQ4295397.1 sensor domain-containing diguanylate cyclase [Stutzerimonas stutzeri]PNF80044.1 GGDEF domain-containing protein [Stutzerimonas stutzeri]
MDLYKQVLFAFVFLLAAAQTSAAPEVVIDEVPVKLTDFRMGYLVDASHKLTFEQARTQPFKETGNRTSLGADARVAWYRLNLRSASDTDQRLFVHLPHAYHLRSVEIYEERDGELRQRELLDMNRAAGSDLMFRGTLVFPLALPAQQSTTLYLRSVSYSHQWFAVDIYNERASRLALVSINTDIALMVGMLLALVFYNALLYFATSNRENIYYSLYLISGLTWIALSYGLIASVFNGYGDAVFQLNMSLLTMPIFLLLFMISIFETKLLYPTEHRLLQALIVLLTVTLIWSCFDISAALKPASSLAALMMLVTFSVSISLYRKGHPLVKYFLIGHSFFVLFNVLAVLTYKGILPPSYISSHGVGIGIVLEALTLAFIISHRIKLLEDMRASQEDLKKQAATDPLTKLYNRRFFFPESDYLLKLARDGLAPISIVTLDIDHFKRINDSHGHACGDKVIQHLAKALKEESRTVDLVARLGGEEFVVLLPGANVMEASQYAERIRCAVQVLEVATSTGETIQVTVSIGVAEIDTALENIESALGRADSALYQAKKNGRNRACQAEPAIIPRGQTLADGVSA